MHMGIARATSGVVPARGCERHEIVELDGCQVLKESVVLMYTKSSSIQAPVVFDIEIRNVVRHVRIIFCRMVADVASYSAMCLSMQPKDCRNRPGKGFLLRPLSQDLLAFMLAFWLKA